MAKSSYGYVMLIIAATLGGLSAILGAIYAYIYFTRIRPRPRVLMDERIRYFTHEAQPITTTPDNQPDRPALKTHPFFIVSYMSRFTHSTSERASAACSMDYPQHMCRF